MKNKLRIICPLGILLVVACALFVSTTWAATDEVPPQAPVVAVAAMEQQDVEAPARNLETLAPIKTISEDDENTSPVEEDQEAGSGYVLTEQERMAVECAVMCEAGGEGAKGQMMVAQCILDGAIRNDISVVEAIRCYKVASTSHSRVTEEVEESVSRVFDDGERVTEEKADLWYNPALVVSAWHEEQQYVTTVGSHRFFWMNADIT